MLGEVLGEALGEVLGEVVEAHDRFAAGNSGSTGAATCRAVADFLRRLGRPADARGAYEETLFLAGDAVERDVLTARLPRLGGGPS